MSDWLVYMLDNLEAVRGAMEQPCVAVRVQDGHQAAFACVQACTLT